MSKIGWILILVVAAGAIFSTALELFNAQWWPADICKIGNLWYLYVMCAILGILLLWKPVAEAINEWRIWEHIRRLMRSLNYKNVQIIIGILFFLTALATAKQFWIFQSWGPFWSLVIIFVVVSRIKTKQGNLKKVFANIFYISLLLLSTFCWFLYFC